MALRGGDHSLIVNAIDLCAHPQVATAKFTGQDQANKKLRVPLQVQCKKKNHAKSKQVKKTAKQKQSHATEGPKVGKGRER
jgi:hypothetical protein